MSETTEYPERSGEITTESLSMILDLAKPLARKGMLDLTVRVPLTSRIFVSRNEPIDVTLFSAPTLDELSISNPLSEPQAHEYFAATECSLVLSGPVDERHNGIPQKTLMIRARFYFGDDAYRECKIPFDGTQLTVGEPVS